MMHSLQKIQHTGLMSHWYKQTNTCTPDKTEESSILFLVLDDFDNFLTEWNLQHR